MPYQQTLPPRIKDTTNAKPSARVIDLAGQRFGKLLVIKQVDSISSRAAWECLCDCGNPKITTGKYLRQGKVSSCGSCYRPPKNCIDISGNRYGFLTALYLWSRDPNTDKNTWLFLCDCGNSTLVSKNDVTSGHTKSCGCHKASHSYALRGPDHPQWKGGVKELKQVIRDTPLYRSWRTSVFKRDDFTCQDCGKRGHKLHAHHIVFLSTIFYKYNITSVDDAVACPALWDLDNGVTLCKNCHSDRHKGTGIYLANKEEA